MFLHRFLKKIYETKTRIKTSLNHEQRSRVLPDYDVTWNFQYLGGADSWPTYIIKTGISFYQSVSL